MKKVIIALHLLSGLATASVTINFSFGPAYTAGGASNISAGTVGVLVADLGAGFGQGESLVGANLTNNTVLGGARILGVMQAFDISGSGDIGFGDAITISDFTGLSHGVNGSNLAFYWFPGITSIGGAIQDGQSYGYFRADTPDFGSGSDIGFKIPADGFDYNLFAYDSSLGGGYDPTLFQANSVAGIPEPSRMVLALLGFAGLMFRRRR